MDKGDPLAVAIREATSANGDVSVRLGDTVYRLRSWTLHKDTDVMSTSWIDCAADLRQLERLIMWPTR